MTMWMYGMPGLAPFGHSWTGHTVVAVLLWSVLVVGAVWCARRFARLHSRAWDFRSQGAGILSAVTILQERYARGEIGREEYIQRQRDLVANAYGDEPAKQPTETV